MRITTLWRNTLITDTGDLLVRVHDPGTCEGEPCEIHGPTDHHMRAWPVWWNSRQARFDRICPCGCGHPDPDQFAYWRELGCEYRAWHACCISQCCGYRCPGPKED